MGICRLDREWGLLGRALKHPRGHWSCARAASWGNPASLPQLPISLITAVRMHEAAGGRVVTGATNRGKEINFNMKLTRLYGCHPSPDLRHGVEELGLAGPA